MLKLIMKTGLAGLAGALLLCGLAPTLHAAQGKPATCKSRDASSGFWRDQGLAIKVSSRLQHNRALLMEKIDVKVSGGVVTLSGNVSSASHIAVAGKIARETSGVHCVNNFLRVGPPIRDSEGY